MHPLRQILTERRCLACAGAFTPGLQNGRADFCPACTAALPRRNQSFCPICGEIYAGEAPQAICPACMKQAPPWGKIYFHGCYEGLLRESILRLKFGGQLHLARGLALLLAGHPGLLEAARGYDLIVPVPLHASRLASRGFNQSGEIAARLGKELGVPLRHAITRSVKTVHQVGLSRCQRVKNLRGAFKAEAGLEGKRILLLDDVMTTGATMASAARSLLSAGAAGVDAVVPARTRARNMLRESRGL